MSVQTSSAPGTWLFADVRAPPFCCYCLISKYFWLPDSFRDSGSCQNWGLAWPPLAAHGGSAAALTAPCYLRVSSQELWQPQHLPLVASNTIQEYVDLVPSGEKVRSVWDVKWRKKYKTALALSSCSWTVLRQSASAHSLWAQPLFASHLVRFSCKAVGRKIQYLMFSLTCAVLELNP